VRAKATFVDAKTSGHGCRVDINFRLPTGVTVAASAFKNQIFAPHALVVAQIAGGAFVHVNKFEEAL
jgi:hypothetical protein